MQLISFLPERSLFLDINVSVVVKMVMCLNKNILFKQTSPGGAADFPDGLKVGIYAEVCPMGVNPKTLPFSNGGKEEITSSHFNHCLHYTYISYIRL